MKRNKSLMLLICSVMMSLNAFSQTATNISTIQLTKPIAKLVIKDLIQFDGISSELLTMQQVLSETNSKLDTQDRLVANLNTQVLNYQTIIASKDEQLVNAAEMSKNLQKELKKAKLQKKLFQFGTVIAGTAVILTYLVE